MSSLKVPISLQLSSSADQPEILAWLETGLALGLIAEHQVRFLSSQYLICPLPEPRVLPIQVSISTTPSVIASGVSAFFDDKRASSSAQDDLDDLAVPTPQRSQTTKPVDKIVTKPHRQPSPPNPLTQLFQSFMDELSVRWLLFLGVFLVIASSGVLAASQWQRFPAIGQYGILLAYTLTFWTVGVWANRQPNLNLTAQTLRLVTLLLVPINFWAMDQFGLGQQVWNWPVLAIAALVLTFVTWQTLPDPASAPRLRQRGGPSLRLLNHLGLSYLHWGWSLAGFPLLAGYLGVIGTTLLTVYQARALSAPRMAETNPIFPQASHRFFLRGEAIWLVYALLILLGRAIFINQIGVTQFGLALGICGWLVAWLDQSKAHRVSDHSEFPWQVLGGVLLVLSWWIAVGDNPAQAIGISLLALDFCRRRLLRSWLPIDLLAIFGIGLQALWLGWRLLPDSIQQTIVVQLSFVDGDLSLWLGVLLIPYGVLFLRLSQWLDAQQKPSLARFTDSLVLAFGGVLTILSAVEPLTRCLNLLGSTLVLAWTTHRYWQQVSRISTTGISYSTYSVLVYLTHSLGILTGLFGIVLLAPKLTLFPWVVTLLVLMVAEWLLSADRWFPAPNSKSAPSPLPPWQMSGWYLGLAMAGASYCLLLGGLEVDARLLPVLPPLWRIIWFVTPLALTGLASFSSAARQPLTVGLSTVALVMAQVLTVPFTETRLLGFGLAFALMLVNTRLLQHWFWAILNVGFGLAVLVASIAEGRLGITPSLETWLLAGAIVPACLWLLRTWLIRQLTPLRRLYSHAVDGWAIFLFSLALPPLVILPWNETIIVTPPAIWGSILLMMMAVTYRSWVAPCLAQSMGWSVVVLILAQFALIQFPHIRGIGLGVATVLMVAHTYLLSRSSPEEVSTETLTGLKLVQSTTITIGFGLSCLAVLLWEYVAPLNNLFWPHWLLVGSLTIVGLWLWWGWLHRRSNTLAQGYGRAAHGWAIVLTVNELIFLTVHSVWLYSDFSQESIVYQPNVAAVAAAAVTIVAILGRSWRQPSDWTVYSIGWGLELLSAEALSFTSRSSLHLAIATVALGFATQLLGDWWRYQHRTKTNEDLVLSGLHVMPLLYGVLAGLLRMGNFTSWTGLASAGIALIVIGVGRRTPALKPLTYLGLVGVSAAAYEYLLYWLSKTPGGEIGDGFIAFAALGTTIMVAYQTLSPWLRLYLNLTIAELKVVTYLHWALSVGLLVIAAFQPVQTALWLGLGTGIFLVQYALLQARRHPHPDQADLWVYLGLMLGCGMAWYVLNLTELQPWLEPRRPWVGAIASLISVGLYLCPWSKLGWRSQPFKIMATLIPLSALWQTRTIVNPISLGIAASFYAFLARHTHRIRLSYISLGLMNWLLVRSLWQAGITDYQVYAALVTSSLIYLIQVDPNLRSTNQREARHQLRLMSLALFATITLWYQDWHGLLPGFLGLVGIGIGLALRIRAFLYVGTLTLVITSFYQLIVLSFEYPLLKWVVGLVVGTALIWIAASFETRREQITTLVRSWFAQLRSWE